MARRVAVDRCAFDGGFAMGSRLAGKWHCRINARLARDTGTDRNL